MVEPNVRVQQSDGADVRNVCSRIDPNGQAGPAQRSADGNVEESRAGKNTQKSLRLKQDNVHNGRASTFRVITPEWANQYLGRCTNASDAKFLGDKKAVHSRSRSS